MNERISLWWYRWSTKHSKKSDLTSFIVHCCLSFLFISIKFSSLEYEVVIVEDNSPDGTLEVANQLKQIFGPSRILIVSRPGKMGLGSAYMDGLKNCTGDFVFLMDADMSHHPRYIPEFIKWVITFFINLFVDVCLWWFLMMGSMSSGIRMQRKSNCDIVTGTRYLAGGGVRVHVSLIKSPLYFSFSPCLPMLFFTS